MKLQDIIENIHVVSVSGSLDPEITDVCFDSRKAKDGSLFCALKGLDHDGNDFVASAVDKGAVAVISGKKFEADHSVTWVEVTDARAAMGKAAGNLFENPSREFPVIGVTGTNGKTTTTFLVHYLLEAILRRAGLIGTIHYKIGDRELDAPHTTPESPEIHRLLREMRDEDCRGVAMEVSSQGLAQSRVMGVSFDVGVFTNLSQDHLDYHKGMENYFASKMLLFEQMDRDLAKEGVALINIDDSYGERLNKAKFERLKKITFGRSVGADYQASDLRSDFNGTQFTLSHKERKFLVRIPLIGDFNVYNAVAAIASAHSIGLNLREVISMMADAPQVPGRLEAVAGRQINYRVFVDYAHTPDALANVIATLKSLEPERLITVFGCGGDRDVTKRAPMAAAAEAGSDLCILTSDNPRTEDPQQILGDAEEGFIRDSYEVIEDRRLAIKRAISLAGERDIVLIAGKGHETYQEVHGVKHEFDDRRIARGFIDWKAQQGGGYE